jgi:SM-20-related protein
MPVMDFNLSALAKADVAREPYPYVILPDFLGREDLRAVSRDFPKVDMAGLFPPEELRYGPAFAQLLEAMYGDALRAMISEKFDIDLTGRPTFLTVRTHARARDGQIHKDSRFKLITVLLSLNEDWAADGGRLRVLRSESDIEDYVAEVPPDGGSCFIFRCTDNAWHGHKSFQGARRCIQMNYVVDEEARQHELRRHSFSAKMKKLGRLVGMGKAA